MPDETAFDAASLVTSAQTAAGFWQMGILRTPLIPGESTRGTYSLMEQLMPAKAGPPPHVHDQDLFGQYRDHNAAHPNMP